jgi:exonuclease III
MRFGVLLGVLLLVLPRTLLAAPCALSLERLLGRHVASPGQDPPKNLKVITYNVAGLEVSLRHRRAGQDAQARMAKFKAFIDTHEPDLLFLQEVESDEALQRFAGSVLNGRYFGFTSPLADPKSPLTAVLVRSDLGLEVRVSAMPEFVGQSIHKPLDPNPELIFKRRPIIVELAKAGGSSASQAPLMSFISVHLKSQAVNTGTEQTQLFRERELQQLRSWVNQYRQRFAQPLPLSLIGDLNADLHTDADLRFLVTQLDLTDALVVANPAVRFKDKVTYAHFRQNKRQLCQLDGHLVSQELSPLVSQARVLQPTAMPVDRAEQMANDSDHNPVLVIYDLSTLLR